MEIAGLVLGIIPIAAKVLSTLYGIYGDVKNAPALSTDLREELGAILALMKNVKHVLEHQTKIINDDAGGLEASARQLLGLLQEIEQNIDANQSRGLHRLPWPFKEAENKRLIEKMERCKGTFNIAWNIAQMYTLTGTFKF